MLQLGKNLRSHYPFITTLSSYEIKTRSTGYNRTVESLKYLLSGLITLPMHTEFTGVAREIHDTLNDPQNIFLDDTLETTVKNTPGMDSVLISINPLSNETMVNKNIIQLFSSCKGINARSWNP